MLVVGFWPSALQALGEQVNKTDNEHDPNAKADGTAHYEAESNICHRVAPLTMPRRQRDVFRLVPTFGTMLVSLPA